MINESDGCLDIYDGGYHALTIKPTDAECTQLSFNIPDYPDQSFKINMGDIPSLIGYLTAKSMEVSANEHNTARRVGFEQLYIEFMNALDHTNRWQYMKEVHPSVQPNVWRECLEVALNKLNGINAPTHRHFSATPFRNEISLCRMFLLGRESYLNKQGKTMLSKPIFKP